MGAADRSISHGSLDVQEHVAAASAGPRHRHGDGVVGMIQLSLIPGEASVEAVIEPVKLGDGTVAVYIMLGGAA